MGRSTKSQVKSARARRRQRSQIQLIVGVAVVAVAAVVILILLSNQPNAGATVDSDYSTYTQAIDRSEVGVGLSIGSATAPVTLVEYSDFSCPHCRDLSDVVHQLIDEYVASGDLRVVFKPVSFVNPPYSTAAAQAAVCAAEQGKGWEMHDGIWALFDSTGPGAYVQRQLVRTAGSIGLDSDAFADCFASADATADVQSVLQQAQQLNITGTPVMFVNGQQVTYRGADVAYGDLKIAIEAILGG
jgi:protein-disulfide isomerase